MDSKEYALLSRRSRYPPLAKGIVLRCDGEYMLAVLPASHHLRLSELRTRLDDNVHIADETEINRLFGTVPAVGKCYGLDIIVDDSIKAQPEILWKLAITKRCFIWGTRSLHA